MDSEKRAIVCAIALNRIFGFEPKFSHSIISALGSAEAVFDMDREQLVQIFGPYSKYRDKICPASVEQAEEEYESLRARGFQMMSIFDGAYPALLKDCPDAPLVLYIRSQTPTTELFGKAPAVAVVGTRDMSPYGREWCMRLVGELAHAPVKPVIVSGLALGVDITAHLSALDAGLATIAVSPVGIDEVYPRCHSKHAARIASSPGSAVITDYPPGTAPLPVTFLRRNRIIAGLSGSTILIESRVKGGGMMTSRLAFDYGRDVFVLPGRVDDARSAGCNLLLREKLAEAITGTESICRQLGLGRSAGSRRRKPGELVRDCFADSLDEVTLQRLESILEAVRERRGISYEELCQVCLLPYREVSELAGMLESEALILTDMFQRCSINPKIA